MLDLEPATTVLSRVVAAIRDDQLSGPTPCPEMTVGDLVDHVGGLALGFTMAAAKTPLEGGPRASAANLGPDWRTGVPARLAEMAQAWRAEAAWTGMTRAGGVDLPGEVAGIVALDEVIVHAWDLAVATGQTVSFDPELVKPAYAWVETMVAQNPAGDPRLFAAAVPVPSDAPLLDRLVGLTGRDPAWRPAQAG
ncbi:TIGR03086 family metal-binding protein [Micromonospora cathayae]|uniref:TIGR03086 family metal-binding protein n=1 Tax=Micromonospora cathayae TaxID=3028804 RepID=A0ABY7ZK14_9ACTN|nr:TIGR03086 family metal-binding protein [Micromonospora sp. HUAS 3]WDZ83222.1 TIGR03086 family metal-binding protein [Micromonospora sp. HUAS 3]